MGVSVLYERGKSLPSAARKSLFGDGMLERARATSLALLGVTAALGLAMVALVFNQNWPLIPGAPIPGFGDRQQAIGDATVAAEAKASSERIATFHLHAGGQGSEASERPAGKRQEGAPTPASQPPVSESVVVADSSPASSPDGGSGDDASPAPPPSAQQPVATPAPVSPPTPVPEVSSPSQPPADSASAPPVQTPVPAAGTPPAESPEEVGDDQPEEEEEGEWGGDHGYSGGGHRGHGHGYGHGHW